MTRTITVVIAFAALTNAVAAGDLQWTTLKGQVICDGEVPKRQPLKVITDSDHCLEQGALLTENWIVQESTRGVKNVFVWLASDPATASGKDLPVHPALKALSSTTVHMDQPHCAFVPHAVGIREGQVLSVKNGSPITHNVRWEPANTIRNTGDNRTIASGKTVEIPNLKQDRLPVAIACSIHPWMKAYVRIFDSPYFAITDDAGRFEIKLAPVGKWRLFVWHEGCGWKGGAQGKSGEELDIKAGSDLDLGQLKIKP